MGGLIDLWRMRGLSTYCPRVGGKVMRLVTGMTIVCSRATAFREPAMALVSNSESGGNCYDCYH
jgi:hypothetical protein